MWDKHEGGGDSDRLVGGVGGGGLVAEMHWNSQLSAVRGKKVIRFTWNLQPSAWAYQRAAPSSKSNAE